MWNEKSGCMIFLRERLLLLLGSYAHIVTLKCDIYTNMPYGASHLFSDLTHRFKPFDQFRTLQYSSDHSKSNAISFSLTGSYKMACVRLNNTKQRTDDWIDFMNYTYEKSFKIRLTAATNRYRSRKERIELERKDEPTHGTEGIFYASIVSKCVVHLVAAFFFCIRPVSWY